MPMDHAGEHLLREGRNQSADNLRFLEEIPRYWEESPGSINAKLENFTKYVSREALTRLLARNEIFLKQLDVPGSVVELGVARGASLMLWAHLSAIYEPTNYTREIIGFDTFSGIPATAKQDTGSEGVSPRVKVGGFAFEPHMKADIERAVRIHDRTRYLGHIPKVRLVEGPIEQTLPEFVKANPHLVVSLLHADTDLYEPTRLALTLLRPRIPKGGVILFDELNCRLFPGETAALADTLGISSLRLRRLRYAPNLGYAVVE